MVLKNGKQKTFLNTIYFSHLLMEIGLLILVMKILVLMLPILVKK